MRTEFLLSHLLLAALWSLPAAAQNPAADLARDKNTDLNPTLREGLATIGRYAETVNRQVNSLSGGKAAAPETQAQAQAQPLPLPPELAGRRQDSSHRPDIGADPFEVSPQLREGRGGNRFMGLPGANVLDLQRRVQVRALLITPQGRAAQLAINGRETVTIMDKELVDLGDLGTFQVQIDREGVALFNPSAPQGKKVVLR